MDKIRLKASSARNRVAEATSSGRGNASLSVPHASLPPDDNASTTAVNEGVLGPQPGTAARDFAAPVGQPTHQPVLEPPTSLASSVDAGQPVPVPVPARGSSRPTSSGPSQDASRLQVPSGRARSNSAPQRRLQHARPAMNLRQPSIGIRREDERVLRQVVTNDPTAAASTSRLPALDETCEVHHTAGDRTDGASPSPSDGPSTDGQEARGSRLRRLSSAAQAKFGFGGNKDKNLEHTRDPVGTAVAPQYRDYAPSFVDVLDTVDPEVQTITSLTNVQNSLFVPNLGRFVNRRPTYTLRRPPSESQSLEEINKILQPARQAQQEQQEEGLESPPRLGRTESEATLATIATIDSHLSDSRYAVLPHGTSLEGWSKEEKKELNDHVRHMLHSRRSRFKRSMRGFGQYVRRPLGFLVTLYATLITLFGLAWVLFLIGWINVGGRKDYIVNVIDNVLVALFAIVGDGLIPFRIVDTYHMIYIAHYHHYTWSRRKKDMLPELADHNDLPTSNVPMGAPRVTDSDDPEKGANFEFTVLTPQQQRKLEHHTVKFCKSHSFYKPHETETHHAFPLRLLVAIVVILDFHSIFQVALGTCTWAINYHNRPFALTTVILCCSITCNATGGLLIWIGDKRTRKKDVLERMNRQELTEHAIHKVEKRRERESESEREDNDELGRKGTAESGQSRGRRSIDVFRPRHSGSNSPHESGHAKEHKHHDKYGHLGHLGHHDKGGKEKEKGPSPLKQGSSAYP